MDMLDPSFNSVAQTQGGMPALLELLQEEYRKYMGQVNAKRLEQGKPTLDAEATLSAARPFLKFCQKYLTENRPVQTFAIDSNYGLVLSNNLRCAVSPGVATLKGTMQETHSVAVSVGLGQDAVGP